MLKLFWKLLIVLIVIYTGVVGWIYLNQRSLLYYPEKADVVAKLHGLHDTVDVYVETADGEKIHGWYNEPGEGKPLFLFLHGNSGHLARRLEKMQELLKKDFGFFIPAWRGFSNSTGEPSEEGLYHDVAAAMKFLEREGHTPDNIIVIGESLGTGLAVKLATEQKFRGLFLITPYTSIADRAQEVYYYLPVRYMLKDNFQSLPIIDKVNTPLLIVHGTNDDVIPHTHSEKLYEAAKEPKKLVLYPGKGHSNLDNVEIFSEMVKFFGLE